MVKAIPEGYQTVTPYVVFKDSRKAITFYEKALGAKQNFIMEDPDGKKVMHAEIKIGSSALMLGDENPQQACKSAATLGASPVSFYVYVEDVDKAFEQALAAGCISDMPVQDMFWGDRIGSVKDPFGHSWSLATHTKDLTSEEIKRGAEEMYAQHAKRS